MSKTAALSPVLEQAMSNGWIGKTPIRNYCYVHPVYSFYLRKKYANTPTGGIALVDFLKHYQDADNFPAEGQILFDQQPLDDRHLILELNNWHFAVRALLALEESIEFPLHAADAVLKKQHRNDARIHYLMRVFEKMKKRSPEGLKDQIRFEEIECINLLARLYEDMGKLEEAISMLQEAEKLLDQMAMPRNRKAPSFKDMELYDHTRALLFSTLQGVFIRVGRFSEAEEAGQKAWSIAKEKCSGELQSDVLLNLGNFYKYKGDASKSLSCYAHALWLGRNDPEKTANIRFNAGALAEDLRQFKKSIRRYQQALTYYELNNNVKLTAETYANLGHVYESQQDYKAAQIAFHRAIERYIFVGDAFKEAQTYQNIAIVNLQQQQYEDCLIYLNKALKIYRLLKREELEAEIYQSLGELYRKQGLYEESIKWGEKARKLFSQSEHPAGVAFVHMNLGNTYLQMNAFGLAIRNYQQALVFFEHLGNEQQQGLVYQNLGELYRRKEDHEACLASFQKAATLLIRFPEDLPQIGWLIALANLAANHFNDRTILEALDPIIQNGLTSAEFETMLEIARNKYQNFVF